MDVLRSHPTSAYTQQIAQLAEHRYDKPKVVGSIPTFFSAFVTRDLGNTI